MTYNKFLQYEVAGKYSVPDDDKLCVSFYRYDYFILKIDGVSYLHEVMNIESISFVLRAICNTFGKDNHSYRSWLSALRSAKSILINLKR